MKPHKWAKEIKAWADGAEIQSYWESDGWIDEICPAWRGDYEYRIKPQPKEPQYLYVYKDFRGDYQITDNDTDERNIGKIKLED